MGLKLDMPLLALAIFPGYVYAIIRTFVLCYKGYVVGILDFIIFIVYGMLLFIAFSFMLGYGPFFAIFLVSLFSEKWANAIVEKLSNFLFSKLGVWDFVLSAYPQKYVICAPCSIKLPGDVRPPAHLPGKHCRVCGSGTGKPMYKQAYQVWLETIVKGRTDYKMSGQTPDPEVPTRPEAGSELEKRYKSYRVYSEKSSAFVHPDDINVPLVDIQYPANKVQSPYKYKSISAKPSAQAAIEASSSKAPSNLESVAKKEVSTKVPEWRK